jgi:hypothetical protein
MLYPLVVVVLVLGSCAFVFWGGVGVLAKVTSGNDLIVRQAALIDGYKAKERILQALQVNQVNQDLEFLGGVVPYSAKVWEIVNLAKVAGEEVGVNLIEWRGFGGEVVADPVASSSPIAKTSDSGQTMTGLYDVDSVDKLQTLLLSLERRIPLVTVTRVAYVPGQTEIDLRGEWSSYKTVSIAKEAKLPEGVEKLVLSLREKLDGFRSVAASSVGTKVSGEGKNNPF